MLTLHSTFRAAMAALTAAGYRYSNDTRYWHPPASSPDAPTASIVRGGQPDARGRRSLRYVVKLHGPLALPAAEQTAG
jgi:hypothetical protein